MKTKSFPLIGLILLLASLLSGCDKLASGVQGIFGSPTPFPTSTPTLTPTATATPLPPLTLLPCPAPDSCPQGSIISDFITSTIKAGGVYTVDIPFNTSIAFHAGWIAQNEFILQQNLEAITPFFAIDGESYYYPYLLGNEPYIDKDGNEYFSAWVGAVLSGWQLGQTRRIRMGFTVNDTITTGWEIYSAGDVVEYTYIVNPVRQAAATLGVPSTSIATDTPAPGSTLIFANTPVSTLARTRTPSATPTPTSTRTPTPTSTRTSTPTSTRTLRPTLVQSTSDVACTVDSSIFINNNTGGILTIFLNGPASFIFHVQTGDQVVSVCAGTYTYSAYACGGSYLKGSLISGAEYDFRCE